MRFQNSIEKSTVLLTIQCVTSSVGVAQALSTTCWGNPCWDRSRQLSTKNIHTCGTRTWFYWDVRTPPDVGDDWYCDAASATLSLFEFSGLFFHNLLWNDFRFGRKIHSGHLQLLYSTHKQYLATKAAIQDCVNVLVCYSSTVTCRSNSSSCI